MSEPCIICQIVKRELPTWIVHETERVICFLPKELNAYGHTVIAPKCHCPDLYTLPEEWAGDLMSAAKNLAVHYAAALGSAGVNLLHASGRAAQQSVFHVHLHLLPRFTDDGLDAWPSLQPMDTDRDELLARLRLDY